MRASWAQVGNDTGAYQLDFNFLPVTTATGQYGFINFSKLFNISTIFENLSKSICPPATTSIILAYTAAGFNRLVGMEGKCLTQELFL